MDEGNDNPFDFQSFDNNLPLSQESYDYIWNVLNNSNDVSTVITNDVLLNYVPDLPSCSGIQMCDVKEESLDSCQINSTNQQDNNIQHGNFQQVSQVDNVRAVSTPAPVSPQIPTSSNLLAPSSLPASQTWPGDYGFTVSFGPQEKNTKGVAWTYSKVKDKLYVGKDVPCPINFSANTFMPEGVSVRVMALYTSPDQVSEIVTRCVHHSIEEINNGIFEAEHLIRCESSNAMYHQDVRTKRHSVSVPFENPQAGQQYSTYIYKFACFGSCSGGPNRRPLMLIFTLERGGVVLGRRKIDVKICACPGRDKKTEEAQVMQVDEENNRPTSNKKEPSVNLASLSDSYNFTRGLSLPKKKKTHTRDREGPYILYAKNKDTYDYLRQMERFYEIYRLMQQLAPEITHALLNHQKKKGEEESD